MQPQQVTVLIDTREQAAFSMHPMKTVVDTLVTADYSIRGLETEVCLERKSLDDLLGVIGHGRERFCRQLQRMASYQHRAVLVEAPWAALENGEYRSKIAPAAATHTIISWITRYGVHFSFATDRASAERWAQYFLFSCAKRAGERLESFRQGVAS